MTTNVPSFRPTTAQLDGADPGPTHEKRLPRGRSPVDKALWTETPHDRVTRPSRIGVILARISNQELQP